MVYLIFGWSSEVKLPFNLTCNVIESMMPLGEGIVSVSTSVASPSLARVSVDDTGPGPGQTAAEDAFEPFHSGMPDGPGIGLSVSRTIVEAHGGTNDVGQSPSGGASLRLSLPRADTSD
jgi:C4-dicarboxylate-specific signal transduction histidine kinase